MASSSISMGAVHAMIFLRRRGTLLGALGTRLTASSSLSDMLVGRWRVRFQASWKLVLVPLRDMVRRGSIGPVVGVVSYGILVDVVKRALSSPVCIHGQRTPTPVLVAPFAVCNWVEVCCPWYFKE